MRLVEHVDVFDLECPRQRAPCVNRGGLAIFDPLNRAHSQSRDLRKGLLRRRSVTNSASSLGAMTRSCRSASFASCGTS
jgi:hypothetical protein